MLKSLAKLLRMSRGGFLIWLSNLGRATWELLKMNRILNYAYDHVWIGQIPNTILGFIIYDFNNIPVKCQSQI